MPDEWKIEIVPLSEVPWQRADIAVQGLVAIAIEDGKKSADAVGSSQAGSVSYEVHGLRQGHHAWITQDHLKCQLVQEVRSGEYEWLGEYGNVPDALHALLKTFP